jgi:hypothetical protein
LTIEKQNDLHNALVESFLKIMGMEDGTPHKAALEKSVNKLFDGMLIQDGSICNFNSLVERFVTTLIQTLISTPFAEDERLNKVKATFPELVSLAVYYNMPMTNLENVSNAGLSFFSKILVHESLDAAPEVVSKPNNPKTVKDNENFLRGIFEDNQDAVQMDINSLPLKKWAETVAAAGVNLVNVQADARIKGKDKLGNKLENLFYEDSWKTFPSAKRIQAIENLITSYAPAKTAETAAHAEFNLEGLHEMAKRVKRMQTKEDMVATLDADIEILRDITSKAVINAIGLERAFISVVTKNVELIREHLQEGEGAKEFRAWIRNNATLLMPAQFEHIIENRAINENRKAIVNAIKVMKNKIDF